MDSKPFRSQVKGKNSVDREFQSLDIDILITSNAVTGLIKLSQTEFGICVELCNFNIDY